jgi:hypothetical protein
MQKCIKRLDNLREPTLPFWHGGSHALSLRGMSDRPSDTVFFSASLSAGAYRPTGWAKKYWDLMLASLLACRLSIRLECGLFGLLAGNLAGSPILIYALEALTPRKLARLERPALSRPPFQRARRQAD